MTTATSCSFCECHLDRFFGFQFAFHNSWRIKRNMRGCSRLMPILLSLFVTVIGTSPAYGLNHLQKAMSFEDGSVFYSQSDLSKIAALSANSAQEYFDIYFEARLRPLTEAERSFMERRRRAIKRTKTFNGKLNGESDRFGGVSVENVPALLVDSLVEYYLAVHELEHSLQTYRVGEGREIAEYDYTVLRNDTDFVFHGEKHAMLAERFFLHYAPEAMRNLALRLLSEASIPNAITAQNSIHWSSLAPEDYLEAQWQSGRYSRFAIESTPSRPSCGDLLFQSARPRQNK